MCLAGEGSDILVAPFHKYNSFLILHQEIDRLITLRKVFYFVRLQSVSVCVLLLISYLFTCIDSLG